MLSGSQCWYCAAATRDVSRSYGWAVATRFNDVISRLRRSPTWLIDAALVVVVGWPMMMDAWWNEPGTTQADGVTYALAGVSVVALAFRRRAPILVTTICALALTGLYLRGHHGELLNLPVMIGLYTLAVQGDRRRTLITGVVACTWSGVLGFTSDDPLGARGGSPVLEMIWPLIPLVLGEAVRARRELTAHTAAEHEREWARRVEAERTRTARELHDVLAHTLAAVNVQTAAAAAALDTRPDIARDALAQARASTKAALGELRATLHLLRDGHDTAPAPGIHELDQIIDTARAADINVTTNVDQTLAPPAAIDLAAYRIVQEAVTNTLRHTRAKRLEITIEGNADVTRVEIVDDGLPVFEPDPNEHRAGLGLLGMSERVNALGGRLEFGPVPGGGFRLSAEIPTDGSANQ